LPGIGVINNPHSRKNRRDPDWMRSLGHIVGTRGTAVATESIEDVDQLARSFLEQGIDVLAINGGDGSNSVALSALIRAYGDRPLPKIALLRGGTMNIAANSCGIKGTPSGLLVHLMQKYREGQPFETTWRDTLRVHPDRYGFVFGNGFIHSFLEALYARGKSTWGATKLLGRGVASSLAGGPFARQLFSGVDARVTVDGEDWGSGRLAAMAAATVEQIGLSFKAFHRWDEQPHTFHLLAVKCSPARFASALPKIYAGRKVAERKMIERVARELVLESAAPIGYTLDGENHATRGRLRLTTGPRLEIIVR
jgi:diacylglycerol kinase family enzyme